MNGCFKVSFSLNKKTTWNRENGVMAGVWINAEPKKFHECDFPGCGKSFPKLWRLKEHQCSAHTGEVRPFLHTQLNI